MPVFAQARLSVSDSGVVDTVKQLLGTPQGALLLSLLATWHTSAVPLLLYCDPWYSFPQHIQVMTAYINIIDVCAFCSIKKGNVEPFKIAKDENDDTLKEAGIDYYFQYVVKRALSSQKKEAKNLSQTTRVNLRLRTYLFCTWIFWYVVLRFISLTLVTLHWSPQSHGSVPAVSLAVRALPTVMETYQRITNSSISNSL